MARILFLIVMMALSPMASGQDCTLPAEKGIYHSYAQLLQRRQQDHCFGESADRSDIARRTNEAIATLKGPAVSAQDYRTLRANASRALSAIDGSLGDDEASAIDAWRQYVGVVRARLAATTAEVALPEGGIPATEWTADANLALFEGVVPISEQVERDCSAGYVVTCQAAQLSAAAILRHAALANEVLATLVSILRVQKMYEELRILDDQWTFYFEHGRSQYPWELWANSANFKRHIDDDRFAPPPNHQLILMHLGAGLEYAESTGSEGSEFNAVALVELIGYNRLVYPTEGRAGRSYGASIIATVSPESDGNRIGWGAMIHFTEKLSLGVARRDLGRDGDETTWLLSADLGRMFGTTSEADRAEFRTPAIAMN
jgi:hypothetical protein